MKGKLFVVEGLDGVGKTTVAKALSEELSMVYVREPGGLKSGEDIRRVIMENDLGSLAEVFLFFASRVEMLNKVLVPAMTEGKDVILDRFFLSTIAYQCYGRGEDLNLVKGLVDVVCGEIKPEVTFVLDCTPEVCLTRKYGGERNRFDDESIEFFRRVREGYLREIGKSVIYVNAEMNEESVRSTIRKEILRSRGEV